MARKGVRNPVRSKVLPAIHGGSEPPSQLPGCGGGEGLGVVRGRVDPGGRHEVHSRRRVSGRDDAHDRHVVHRAGARSVQDQERLVDGCLRRREVRGDRGLELGRRAAEEPCRRAAVHRHDDLVGPHRRTAFENDRAAAHLLHLRAQRDPPGQRSGHELGEALHALRREDGVAGREAAEIVPEETRRCLEPPLQEYAAEEGAKTAAAAEMALAWAGLASAICLAALISASVFWPAPKASASWLAISAPFSAPLLAATCSAWAFWESKPCA